MTIASNHAKTDKAPLRAFINRAERSWFNVFDSANSKIQITRGGVEYYQLPIRFSTRAKVLAYFKQFWSCTISQTLFCNLKTITHKGRLYVIAGDPPFVPLVVVSLRVVNETNDLIKVKAILSGDPDGNVPVAYLIRKKQAGQLRIIKRFTKSPDFRYSPCR